MDSQTEAHALCVHLSSSDAFSVEDSFTSVSVFFVPLIARTNSFQKYWFRSQSTGTLGGEFIAPSSYKSVDYPDGLRLTEIICLTTNNLDKYLYMLYCVGFNILYIPQI